MKFEHFQSMLLCEKKKQKVGFHFIAMSNYVDFEIFSSAHYLHSAKKKTTEHTREDTQPKY